MIHYLFTLILLANVASASDLDDRLFKHLCNGSQQRVKLESSWVSKPSSQAGQRLDIAQEKAIAEQELFQKQAREKFASRSNRYTDEGVQDYLNNKEFDLTNLVTYLANEFVLMIPQNLHADTYAEGCLGQYGEANQFLGYRDGQPVLSALMDNRAAIWSCYALKNTQVLASGEKFTSRIDLNTFCKYARPADSFLAK